MKDANHVTRIGLILDSLFEACKAAREDGLSVTLDVCHDADVKLPELFGEYDDGCPTVNAHLSRGYDV